VCELAEETIHPQNEVGWGVVCIVLFNPLLDDPRSNLTSGFQSLIAQSTKELKIFNKYVTLGFFLENVSKLLYGLYKA
jgi:hypothetical protein